MSETHPEFAPAIPAKVAQAVLERYRADPALAAFCVGGIDDYEVEALLRGPFATLREPAIAVILDATDERRSGSNRKATIQTRILTGLVTSPRQGRGASGWLRARVVDHITRLLARDFGTLYDPADGTTRITEALLTVQRVPQPVVLSDKYLLTRVQAVFESDITEATGEFIE